MIKKESIPYQDLSYFKGIISSYLNQDDVVKPLYHNFPTLDNFKNQLTEKQESWGAAAAKRNILKNALLKQYDTLSDKQESVYHIESLALPNTFTITTGHQLNLFTGPLYFLYKIISTINLCKQLRVAYPTYNFVPVYWMATEDHDFEEIQYFNYDGRKIVYEKEAAGAVGHLDTDGLEKVFNLLTALWPDSAHGKALKELFKNAYLENETLTTATRFLAHELFKSDGLVIVDGDDAALKTLAIPYFKEELCSQTSFNAVSKTVENWPAEFNIQVNPREVNLFYLTAQSRNRIISTENGFKIDELGIQFTKKELLLELENHPERFSPNVIMRPLYQEVILPNLCYIGGGGELAYWLQLKHYFKTVNVTFPMLLLRNSALLVTHKQNLKLEKLACTLEDLFLREHELATQVTKKVSSIKIDLTTQRTQLQKQFKELYDLAAQTDRSFKGAVAAQEKKQLNGLDYLEKRLLKAQKKKVSDHINRAVALQLQLFPGGSLQERKENFAAFYLDHGMELLEIIKANLDPLDFRFTVIKLPEI